LARNRPDLVGFGAAFRANLPAETRFALWEPDGTAHPVTATADGVRLADGPVTPAGRDLVVVATAGGLEARRRGRAWRFLPENPLWAGAAAAGPSDGQITAPMPGRLIGLFVKAGDVVKAGDRLAVLEAMKMEHRLTAPYDAIVDAVSAIEGAQVSEGALLVTLAQADRQDPSAGG
ncbi:MAG: acetyl-CoA carboxylase biotin carboxyl carrier protein subunit, partial [Sandaracinobacteroides sp.]